MVSSNGKKSVTKGTKKKIVMTTLKKPKRKWNKKKSFNDLNTPKKVRTPLDLKKKIYNSTESQGLIDDHIGKNICKNIKKKVKEFGFKVKTVVTGYKDFEKNGLTRRLPIYKTNYIYSPSKEILNRIPNTKYDKERFMYSEDAGRIFTFAFLKETLGAKKRLVKLKISQPEKGHRLVTKRDIDVVFGRIENEFKMGGGGGGDNDVEMKDKPNERIIIGGNNNNNNNMRKPVTLIIYDGVDITIGRPPNSMMNTGGKKRKRRKAKKTKGRRK